MGLASFAAKEGLELATHTLVGKAAIEAAQHGIAEVFSSVGLKRAAAAVTRSNLGLEELEYLKSEADAIHNGKIILPHGDFNPKFTSAADGHRWRLTGFAEGSLKASGEWGFGSIPQRMQFPKAWVDNGIYTYERTFNSSGASSHRLIANLPRDISRPIVGDRVEIGAGTRIRGEYMSLYPKTEVGPVALVKMDQNYFREPELNTAGLMPANKRLWFDESGAVYSSSVEGDVQTPKAESLKFLAEIRAADPKDLGYLSGERPLPPQIHSLLKTSDVLIRANVEKPMSLLYALSSAPQHGFTETPLLPWKPSSLFNPGGGESNCMACTAAVLRTLRSRALTTTQDIAKMVSRAGERLGEPYFGRFDNEGEAFDWFTEASGAKIVDRGTLENGLKPGSTYAITMNLGRGPNNNVQHMIFGHAFQDHTSVFFDAQSGVQLKESSVFKPNMNSYFYELKPAN